MRKRLEDDAGLRDALADRILQSRIGDAISKESDPRKKWADLREWIDSDSQSAAMVALGLARDDASGNNSFEMSSVKIFRQTYYRNPNAERGAYGVLKSAAKKSKFADKAEQDVSNEQRREALRTLFEGQGSQIDNVVTGRAPEGKPASERSADTTLASSFYDRLSAGNIHGYSPELLAMQNSLNLNRAPGSPKLIETGRLNYPTLSYPAFGLRYDLGRLEDRLKNDRLAHLAKYAGVRLTPNDLKDESLEKKLLDKSPSARISARLAARAARLGKAQTAIASFEDLAARSKNPANISKALLVELSSRQREAARWITAAAVEENLDRLEEVAGFLDADLIAAIDYAPVPAPTRQAYKARGSRLQQRLSALKEGELNVLALLQSDDWPSKLEAIEKTLRDNKNRRNDLLRDIADYRLTPYQIGRARLAQARWRILIDDLIVRFAPSTRYGRSIRGRRQALSLLIDIFGKIASGDFESARRSLVTAQAHAP
ncbi:MAG: hypothetical protein AAB036_07165 [Elusimicrobiota bacterium]